MRNNKKAGLLKIYVGEHDTYKGKLLFEEIVWKAKDFKMAGVTVFRGIMGFGADTHLHSATLLRFSENLPLVIEIVDKEEKIDEFIPVVKEMSAECFIFKTQVDIVQVKQRKCREKK